MKTRKTNKSKKVDKSCSNYGGCPWCEGNRTYSNRHRLPADSVKQQEYLAIEEGVLSE